MQRQKDEVEARGGKARNRLARRTFLVHHFPHHIHGFWCKQFLTRESLHQIYLPFDDISIFFTILSQDTIPSQRGELPHAKCSYLSTCARLEGRHSNEVFRTCITGPVPLYTEKS